jgi:hypothetical protein
VKQPPKMIAVVPPFILITASVVVGLVGTMTTFYPVLPPPALAVVLLITFVPVSVAYGPIPTMCG